MRKLLIIPFLFISCWKKTSDGREYKINCDCKQGHYETVCMPITSLINGNVVITTQV